VWIMARAAAVVAGAAQAAWGFVSRQNMGSGMHACECSAGGSRVGQSVAAGGARREDKNLHETMMIYGPELAQRDPCHFAQQAQAHPT